jgi:hypothetical protein
VEEEEWNEGRFQGGTVAGMVGLVCSRIFCEVGSEK